jgi:hypothetical protein
MVCVVSDVKLQMSNPPRAQRLACRVAIRPQPPQQPLTPPTPLPPRPRPACSVAYIQPVTPIMPLACSVAYRPPPISPQPVVRPPSVPVTVTPMPIGAPATVKDKRHPHSLTLINRPYGSMGYNCDGVYYSFFDYTLPYSLTQSSPHQPFPPCEVT